MNVAQARMPKWVPIELQAGKMTFKSYNLPFLPLPNTCAS